MVYQSLVRHMNCNLDWGYCERGVIRGQHRPTAEQLSEAVKLYAKGWSLVEIGERLGFDQSTIWKGLTRLVVEMRRPLERG